MGHRTSVRRAGYTVVGAVLLALSFVRVTITGTHGTYVERVLDVPHRLWVFVALLPGAWVLRSPCRKPILLWAAWVIATAAGLDRVAGEVSPMYGTMEPWWPEFAGLILMLTEGALIVLVLPLIRLGDRELPKLPRARVYRGE